MKCKNHPEENGVNTCNQCGSWLCERCTFERGSRIFCPACASQTEGAGMTAVDSAHYSTAGDSAHYGSTGKYRTMSHSGRRISWGLLFLFSVVIPLPGLNYMYMGLIKRGLVAMSAFFGTIYLSTLFNGGFTMLFIFAIPVLILACIFDGFRLRLRINSGEEVADNIDDITEFIRKNRVAITGFLLILLAANVVGGMIPWLLRVLRSVLPILIIAWVVYALFKKKP